MKENKIIESVEIIEVENKEQTKASQLQHQTHLQKAKTGSLFGGKPKEDRKEINQKGVKKDQDSQKPKVGLFGKAMEDAKETNKL